MKNVTIMIMVCVMALVLEAGVVKAQEAVYVFKPLPYAFDALEPYIDAQTMEIHYSRHHQAYFNNMVKALQGTEWDGQPLESLFAGMTKLPVELRNNAGGHWNHAMFWDVMSPQGGGTPTGELAKSIDASFGSFEAFKQQFSQAAAARFGSGWVWLCVGADGMLFVSSTANQDNPLMDVVSPRGTPLLGLDVWEHAYYLKYQNKRSSYVDAFWNVVNWPEVAKRYSAAKTLQD
ncbi:MAG TPA: superoxide dismutase [Candidatus Omnitrophota bacterium]|nr:superoxide dismutase [Candidatus Omnitrophota bacterium]HQP11201.1 superoxide dismutase [Candidatus Omnitrophota bacterium]